MKKSVKSIEEKKDFLWWGLRVSFGLVIISLIFFLHPLLFSIQFSAGLIIFYLLIISFYLFLISLISSFIFSILSLIKKRDKILSIVVLVITSLIIFFILYLLLNGFFKETAYSLIS